VGRAGRGDRPGRALVQTYQPEHPALVAVASGDGTGFVEAELERRQRFGSPPYGRLVKLTVALPDREAAQAAAGEMVARLRQRALDVGSQVAVLGPVPAYVARRGGRWRFHVVLRGADPSGLLGGDPGSPWSVDVDPESLL
jgi:primosomal protein N' (replication factor Y)